MTRPKNEIPLTQASSPSFTTNALDLEWDTFDQNSRSLQHLLDHNSLCNKTIPGILHTAVTRFNDAPNNDGTRKTLETIASHESIKLHINEKNIIGKTALHIAVQIENPKAMQILLANKADPNVVDNNGHTPIDESQNQEIKNILSQFSKPEGKLEEPETPEAPVSEFEPENAQTKTTSEEEITKIFQSVQNGELPKLGADFNINYQNLKGNTLLHFAVEYENPHLATFINTYEPDLNIQNNLGDTPLHFAALKGYLGTVELLVKNNADPKIANFKGDPPLNLAAINNFAAVADYLSPITYPHSVTNIVPNQELSAETTAEDLENPSPETFVATQNTSTPTDEEQLPESQNQVGPSNHPQSQTNPPLYEAAKESDLQTVNNLLNSNVDVNALSTSMQNTALHIALRNKNVEIVKLLLENGADVDLENRSGVTALHLAVYNNNVEMVKLVLEKSKNVNLINSFDGKTALHVAVYNNNVEMVQLLIAKGAGVDIKNKDCDTALHLAVRNQQIDIARLLLEKSENVDIKNKDGMTALYLAVDNENVEIVQLLIAKDADVNTKNKHGYPVLHAAARITKDNEDKEDEDNEVVEDTEILLLLLEKGANVDITCRPWNATALHYAAEWGDIEVAKSLIEYKADLNILNDKQDTALRLAVFYQKIDIARLLLEKGVDVNAQIGNIPADQLINRAITNEDTEMVRLLITHGAQITKGNFDSVLHSRDEIKTLIETAYNAQHPAHSWFSIDIGGIFSWVKSWLSGGNENNTENSHNQDDAHSPMNSHDSEHTSEASTGWLNSIFSFFSNLWSPAPSDHHPEPNTSVVGDNHVPPVGEPHE